MKLFVEVPLANGLIHFEQPARVAVFPHFAWESCKCLRGHGLGWLDRWQTLIQEVKPNSRSGAPAVLCDCVPDGEGPGKRVAQAKAIEETQRRGSSVCSTYGLCHPPEN